MSVQVSTLSAQSITETSANLRGRVDDDGGSSELYGDIEWREKGETTWNNILGGLVTESQIYSLSASGLTPGTEYEFRARVEDWDPAIPLIYYGDILEFETDPPPSQIKYWDDGWVIASNIKFYIDGSWQSKPIKVWHDSQWKQIYG